MLAGLEVLDLGRQQIHLGIHVGEVRLPCRKVTAEPAQGDLDSLLLRRELVQLGTLGGLLDADLLELVGGRIRGRRQRRRGAQ
ncbi:MAG: hypothetical protein NVSMB17_02380 [Candidatus Dormibacteria bacterium]